jgi:hypothetical protein
MNEETGPGAAEKKKKKSSANPIFYLINRF